MKAAEKSAQLVARFYEIFKGPPPVEKITTHPESAEYWRELVADTGANVTVVEDESVTKDHARFTHSDAPTTTANPEDAIHVVFHRPKKPQSVRIETGPVGTEIHLEE
jgi:hypothetical protein